VSNLPQDVANQALDAIGSEVIISDLEDGSREAQVLLRAYGQCLRQLLRCAHWNFARAQTPLNLLADATGQTANVGTNVPIPWVYEYAYPIDCMKIRFLPWNTAASNPGVPANNIQTEGNADNVPLMTNLGQAPTSLARIIPARFTEAHDPNFPGSGATWNVQGQSPIGSTVILTNVKNAQIVYTKFVPYPSLWDSLFRGAFVAYLAQEVCMAILKDKKFALTMRAQQINVAKQKIQQARLTDGNEGWYSSDISVDWLRARNTGVYNSTNWGDGGPGVLWGGWDMVGFADGSAY
jgi:hypothetical protein